MAIPEPGKPVRGSSSGVPIMALFDLMGRSWAIGVVWQLQGGPFTFRELQDRCESISPAILNARVKDLREAGIIEKVPGGYLLTPRGRQLVELLKPFGDWSRQWAKDLFRIG